MVDRDSLPTALTVGPVTFEIHPTSHGLRAQHPDKDKLLALCWVMDMTGSDDELFEATQTGGTWYGPDAVFDLRPLDPDRAEDEELVQTGREQWEELTGQPLDEKACIIRAGGHTSVVPFDLLAEMARELRKINDAHPLDPPWLFRLEPIMGAAHESEEEPVVELEQRIGEMPAEAAASEVEALGLASAEYAEQKYDQLERWGAHQLLDGYADFLAQEGLGLGDPPWLFTRTPRWTRPHPSEQATLRALDEEIRAVDEAELALDGELDPPELIQRRCALLQRLDRAGLLTAESERSKDFALRRARLDALRERYEIAIKALRYLTSYERERYNPDAKETEILEAPVCLDIFRGLKAPAGVSELAWISWGEYLLRTHGPGKDVQADQGDFPYQDQDGLIMVVWRKDAGFPALRYVRLMS